MKKQAEGQTDKIPVVSLYEFLTHFVFYFFKRASNILLFVSLEAESPPFLFSFSVDLDSRFSIQCIVLIDWLTTGENIENTNCISAVRIG